MQQRVPDLLALSGDGYSEIRGAIVQAIVDESDQSFKDALQVCHTFIYAMVKWMEHNTNAN